jgi:transcriptional regulator with XRE-family HTH domain
MHSEQKDIRNLLFGDRIRQLRKAKKLSIRDAAAQIGVDKSTLMRLEQGDTVSARVREKACLFFQIMAFDPLSRPLAAEFGSAFVNHLPESGQWQMVSKRGSQLGSVTNEDIQDPAERQRLGRYGLATSFYKSFQIRMMGTGVSASINEVYAINQEPHPKGDYCFIYCVKGSLKVVLKDEEFVVAEGSAAMFQSPGVKYFEPAKAVSDELLPVVCLFVDWPKLEIRH